MRLSPESWSEASPRRAPELAFRGVAFLCVLSATSGAAAAGASSGKWELTGEGHGQDPRLAGLLRFVEEASRESWKRLGDELGLTAGELPVRWVLDISPPPAVSTDAPAQAEFFEAGQTAFSHGQVVVCLPARKYLGEPRAARQVVAHETAHAILASFLGSRQRYDLLPRWLREGIALWLADEGDLRVKETIAQALFRGGSADSFLAGIPPSTISSTAVSGAESYLGVRCLKEHVGVSGLRALVEAARGGEVFETSLARVLGASLPAFRSQALEYAREEVRLLISPARKLDFRESLRLRDDGRLGRAEVLWRKLLAEEPQGLLAATLRYLLARYWLAAADDRPRRMEARWHLEMVLSEPGVLWRPEAMVLLGDACEKEGDGPRARALWRQVLEVFGEDSVPASKARQRLGKN